MMFKVSQDYSKKVSPLTFPATGMNLMTMYALDGTLIF